ncbi:hypothetical protein JCM10449v2_007026 [Rhodotorula kratochvilovae]
MGPKIVVHWLADSRSQRVLWLLEELNLPYEVKEYHRDWNTFQIPNEELGKAYPLKRFPAVVLEDADAGFPEPTTLAESGAIFETLLAAYGTPSTLTLPLSPPALAAKHRFWIHWAEGTAMFHMIFYIVMNRLPSKFNFVLAPFARIITGAAISGFVLPNLRKSFDFMETELGDHEYFVGGAFSAADLFLSCLWELLLAIPGLDAADYPKLQAWYARISAREAFARAEKRGSANHLEGYFS